MTRTADGLTEVLTVPEDEDSVIAIKSLREGLLYVQAGTRLRKDHWLAVARPDAFASVTRNVDRARAWRARWPFYLGETIDLYPGMWTDELDPRIKQWPQHFERVDPR